jgi:hypothetical protein
LPPTGTAPSKPALPLAVSPLPPLPLAPLLLPSLRGAVRPGAARPRRPRRGAPASSPAWRARPRPARRGGPWHDRGAHARLGSLPPRGVPDPPPRPWHDPLPLPVRRAHPTSLPSARRWRPARRAVSAPAPVQLLPGPPSAWPSSPAFARPSPSLRGALGASARPGELPYTATAPAPGPGIPPGPTSPAATRSPAPARPPSRPVLGAAVAVRPRCGVPTRPRPRRSSPPHPVRPLPAQWPPRRGVVRPPLPMAPGVLARRARARLACPGATLSSARRACGMRP